MKDILIKINKKMLKKGMDFEYLFAAFLCSFIISTILITHKNTNFQELEFISTSSKIIFVCNFFISFIAITGITYIIGKKQIIPYCLFFISLAFSFILVIKTSNNIYFNLILGLIMGYLIYWLVKDDKLNLKKCEISDRFTFYFAIGSFIIFTLLISIVTILRYRGYASSTFDFGIFAQMFEYMKNTGIPYTTLERNTLLSHMSVHFSPIFYLLLPGYMLFSAPEYLLFCQAIAIGAGVFVVRGIGKTLKMKPLTILALMAIYIFLPSMTGGLFYDFHENKFLTVLILSLVYFILNQKNLWIIIFTLLVLMVKEDAAIYTITLGLFMMFTRKEYKMGGIICAISFIYFIIVIYIMSQTSEGLMTFRYDNLIPANSSSGFMSILSTCLFNFPYVLSSVFTPKRFEFIFWAIGPLMFIPLMSKKVSSLLLLLPMLVINLMSGWEYQHNIDYQYTFGSIALVFFLFILVVKELKKETLRFVSLTCIVLTMIFCISLNCGKFKYYIQNYVYNKNEIKEVNDCLNRIPFNASITASTYFTPYLYNRSEIYLVQDDILETDYFVFNPNDEGLSNIVEIYLLLGYKQVDSGGFVVVYKNPNI